MRSCAHAIFIVSVALVFHAVDITPASAAPIALGNDVDISWSQIGFEACETLGLCPAAVDVSGLPRLVPDAADMGEQLFFDIDVIGNSFAAVFLDLIVADTQFNEVFVGGVPLVLEFTMFSPGLAELFLTYPNGILQLKDFTHFDLLPQDVDLVFVLRGTFEGSSSACIGCPYGASIDVTGAGTEIAVAEPAVLLLLLVGTGVATARRFHGPRPLSK